MKYDGNSLLPFEWFLSIVWILFWAVLGYVAVTQREISLAGRFMVTHSEGLAAVILGLALFGVSLLGMDWLLRLNAFRNLLRLLVFLVWLGGSIIYLAYFYH